MNTDAFLAGLTSFALFMAIAFLASPVAPMLLAFISGNLFRETRIPVGYNAQR